MKQFKIALACCLSVLAVLLVVFGCKRLSSGQMYLCDHSYALCTSAYCIPQPGDHTKAICFCDVEKGDSMSTVPCDELQPGSDANGITTIYSTFSFKQYMEGKKTMKCPSSTPWTWCLNKRCTVDPSDSTKAICLCDIMRTNEDWVTLGGSCDSSTCNTSYWSGAGLKDFKEGNAFMTKKLNLDPLPVKWCQSNP
jgi:hypothetical protein